MSQVGAREIITQQEVIQFFTEELDYRYLGNWHKERENHPIEESILRPWLQNRGVSDGLINRLFHTIRQKSAIGGGRKLYDANRDFYTLLRYGIQEAENAGEHKETIYLIDWENIENNDFAIAEEVTYKGNLTKRPDIVLYVNGIALGILELKRAKVDVAEGIRQNILNQEGNFIRDFFVPIQLIMAGNTTQGIRYGTIETPEKYYLKWNEETLADNIDNPLLKDLQALCSKARLLEFIHNFIVFDSGIKKVARANQFFGTKAAIKRVKKREGGILWHTQGSGKSLTMVWLAKWILENITHSRILIVTDRTELDAQIEMVFKGVDEPVYRTTSGADLLNNLNETTPSLMGTLVHKFGSQNEREGEKATVEFITELKGALPPDFKAKGDIFVFVDECHRTQSGLLHEAMKTILPHALFIGFTGTPLLSRDKKTSLEVFGSYIHTYKFDKAVQDGVVLDLRYEARHIPQHLSSQKKVDEWFDLNTKGLSNLAITQIKQRWGTMQKLLSSKDRLSRIMGDIQMDFLKQPRLSTGRGNAMLVCDSIYSACRAYSLLSGTELGKKSAVITSYSGSLQEIKDEATGEGRTEKKFVYDTYRSMLASFFEEPEEALLKPSRLEEFERIVKERFIKEPGRMRLLIVVDKLLTGFDAPPATYLYIDKKMQDHGLFQAICRVNRLDGNDKDYGYIIDYKDLFKSLENAFNTYTSEAFEGYDEEDVEGLLKDRLDEGKNDLEDALEAVEIICEEVRAPRNSQDYFNYFVGASSEEVEEKEALRLTFYKAVARLIRAYANIANDLHTFYSEEEIKRIKSRVQHFESVRSEVKLMSADQVDMKKIEPAMRQLLDNFIRADDSESLIDFEELGLLQILIRQDLNDLTEAFPKTMTEDNIAESIENNIRKRIIEENLVNPVYYERMSELLDGLIEQRRQDAISYQDYLEKVKAIAAQVVDPESHNLADYPPSLNSFGKKALYDYFEQSEFLAMLVDSVVQSSKRADWIGDIMKERELKSALYEALRSENIYKTPKEIENLLSLIKEQHEYR